MKEQISMILKITHPPPCLPESRLPPKATASMILQLMSLTNRQPHGLFLSVPTFTIIQNIKRNKKILIFRIYVLFLDRKSISLSNCQTENVELFPGLGGRNDSHVVTEPLYDSPSTCYTTFQCIGRLVLAKNKDKSWQIKISNQQIDLSHPVFKTTSGLAKLCAFTTALLRAQLVPDSRKETMRWWHRFFTGVEEHETSCVSEGLSDCAQKWVPHSASAYRNRETRRNYKKPLDMTGRKEGRKEGN